MIGLPSVGVGETFLSSDWIRRLQQRIVLLARRWQPLERVSQQRGLERQLLVAHAQLQQPEQRLQPELQFGERELEQQQPQPQQRVYRPCCARLAALILQTYGGSAPFFYNAIDSSPIIVRPASGLL